MTKAPRSTPTPAQVTMTLSALAATAATPRPSGETLQEQAQRAMRGITAQLKDVTLATHGTWQLMWLALSPDNANLVYIAWNSDGSNQFAVVVRGTIDNPTDMMEDLGVGTVVPFTAGGTSNIAVSSGAMAAFTQVATARGITGAAAEQAPEDRPGPPGAVVPSNATLKQALAAALSARPPMPQPVVYVTGHSLGGCIATMLATYLQAQTWGANKPLFALVTFAAPTAGLKSFADYVDSRLWSLNERYVNAYDLVPRAWTDLATAKGWYPPPGPAANEEVKLLLTEIDLLRKGNAYVQPSATSARTMNANYSMYDKELVNKTTGDYLGQVAFQHANSTYLTLLGAPVVPAGPVVTAVNPTAGQGNTQVIITGSGFDTNSVVDFGPIPCTDAKVDPSGTRITAIAPDGTGIVDVRVTNNLGTSPAVGLGKFAYDNGPAPVVVSAVAPRSGKADTRVTINGSGFAPGAVVRFKDTVAGSVTVNSPTVITAAVPSRPIVPEKTVNVTVTVGVATSPTGTADEFTYAG
ncbi:IPT/TIG domain-containing protein [Streptomyces decoyicus]|uniref:lipase family protein n=1 Tax=Streptomyces decoyicus TaxID=249567 RepID=UPI003411D726